MAVNTPPTPPLTSFGVSNFRCFDAAGFRLVRPARVNVVIGKNNAGKSTLLRAIELFAGDCGVSGRKAKYQPATDSHHRAGKPVLLRATADYGHLRGNNNQGWNWESLVRQVSQAIPDGIEVEFGLTQDAIVEDWRRSPLLNANLSSDVARGFVECVAGRGFPSTPDGPELIQSLNAGIVRQIRALGRGMFANPLVIPVPRQFAPASSEASADPTWFDGRGVIDDLRNRQHPDPGEAGDQARDTFDELQTFLRDLLGESTLLIEVPPHRHELMVRIRSKKFNLPEFGTGLHHLMLMCAAFAVHRQRTIYLEEPEIHLHPELQRKFFRFLLDRTDNRYFITTHSPVFLDEQSGDQVAVHHVTHDGERATVSRMETPDAARGVLRDLGCKPSDLLLANGVVWVEGPSDRLYLRRWLELLAPDLREGIHFVFNFLGGSLLSHYGFADGTALVPALRMNPNVILVVDRDTASGQPPSKLWVERVQAELGPRCWVTHGWEVENYVREERVRAAYAGEVSAGITFGPDEQLKDVLTRARTTSQNLNLGKMAIAERLTVGMSAEDLDHLDLRQRLEQVVAAIRDWNHIGV